MKEVKYWKVIQDGISFSEAVKALEIKSFEEFNHRYLSVRLGWRVFTNITQMNQEKFSPAEALSNNWEIIIPDDEREDKLNDLRDIIKEANFLGQYNNYKEIDHMDINGLYHAVDNFFTHADDDMKIRLIKVIINQKLYKKI